MLAEDLGDYEPSADFCEPGFDSADARCRVVAMTVERAGSMIHGPGGGVATAFASGLSWISPTVPVPDAEMWATGWWPGAVTTAVSMPGAELRWWLCRSRRLRCGRAGVY